MTFVCQGHIWIFLRFVLWLFRLSLGAFNPDAGPLCQSCTVGKSLWLLGSHVLSRRGWPRIVHVHHSSWAAEQSVMEGKGHKTEKSTSVFCPDWHLLLRLLRLGDSEAELFSGVCSVLGLGLDGQSEH